MTVVQLTTDNREPFRQYDRPQPWFGTAPEALLQGFAESSGVTIHVVTCTQQRMKSSPEKLSGNIWFHSLHVPKWGWMRTGFQGCVRAIRRKVRNLVPDIVHGQGTERECAIAAALSGFPNVVTIHGNMAAVASYEQSAFGRFYRHCAAALEAVALRRTSGVFCNSAYTQSLVAKYAKQTWRVPNALRSAFFDEPQLAGAAAVPILLNVGVISPRKRQVELLDLARDLHCAGHKFVVHFIGDANPQSDYGRAFSAKMTVAKAAGYADHLGTCDTTQLIAYFDSASALLHLPREEAFGLVVAEALSRNLKVFGSKVGGIVDIAAGVGDAELFEPDAWREMATAIGAWLSAGSPRSFHGAEMMSARYHPRIVAGQHLAIYRELLSTRA